MFFRRNQRGVAAVEFAIVAPLLLLLVFGIINYGFLFYDQAVITNAAREGARWGVIPGNGGASGATVNCSGTATGNSDACEVANSYAQGRLFSFGSASTPSTNASGVLTTGQTLSVTTTYAYTGIGYAFGASSYNLTATSTMYHE